MRRVGEVWDCFMFAGELDLLEYRLRELGEVVDHFVISEAALTHTGRPKPLHYWENRDRFSAWSDRIVHVVAELDEHASHPWRREEQQRRSLRDVLRSRVAPDDAVIVGDVDEFVDRNVVAELAKTCTVSVTLGMAHAIYFANWWMPVQWIAPPIFARGSQLGEPHARALLGEPHEQWDGFRQRIVDGCGVHVSYGGGADAVRRKFIGHPDTYLDTPRFHRPGWIEWCLAYGVHFEGWSTLRRLRADEMPPLLTRMNEYAPHLFDFTPVPPEAERNALCGYAWLRRSHRIPDRTVEWLDSHPDPVTKGAPSYGFRAIDAARRARRRLWNRPEPPSFLPLESPLRARGTLRLHPEWLDPIHLSIGDFVTAAGER